MKSLFSRGRSIVSNTDGATAIEYALIATLVAVVIIGALTFLGTQTSGKYDEISTAVSAAGN